MADAAPLLEMFCIYENPADHPGMFVVRRTVVVAAGPKPDDDCQVAPTLEAARLLVPVGLVRHGRLEDDERRLAEVWL